MGNDIFAFDFSDELKIKADKAAELFEFPAFQFYTSLEGDKRIQAALLEHDVAFYEEAIEKIATITSQRAKMFERAKFQKIVFGDAGISSGDVCKMCEQMNDRYYR